MASEKNLNSIFSDIANAIREKTKTTDKIKVFDMSKKINEMSGSVDIVKPIYAEQKTPVPNSGHLEKFFFNTKLNPAQVDALIANANLNFISGGSMLVYPILMTNTEKVISIFDVSSQSGVESGSAWLIADLNSDATYYVSPALEPDDPTHAGWIQNSFTSYDTGEIAINAELVQANQGVEIGSQNNLLTDLVCITAIVDSGKVEILKTLEDQYKLVENSLEFDGSKSTTYDYDFISNINEETKEITVIKNIAINGVSTLKKYLDYKKSVNGMFHNDSNITFSELNEILSYDDTSNITIMERMFYGCSSLTSVPQLNTSNNTSMRMMFSGCSSLTSVPQLNTAKVTDMYRTFDGCSSLATIPLLNTSKTTNMNAMFSNCSSLATIPLLQTSNATDMSQMFQYCTNLPTIPLLDTSNATDMSYMFYGCSSLTSVPQLNTAKVTNMSYMFEGCTSLTSIPELDTANVTNMSRMFNRCQNLITIPLLNTSNVTDMYYMFNNCLKLTTIPLINTSSATDMSYMFSNCNNLTSIPPLDTHNVRDMSFMFQRCHLLTKVDITYTDNFDSWDSTFWDCHSLIKFIIRNMGNAPVIQTHTFANCYHFTGTVNSTYNPNGLKDGRIYVPDNMVNTLKSATNWSKYADIIVPLSTLKEE